MEKGNWNELAITFDELDNDIFKEYDKSKLSDFEKRKIIFNYMCNNLSYDFDYFEKVVAVSKHRITFCRDPYKEVESVLVNKKGICNAIAQVYRVLLELNGIYSLCVNCDNMMEVPHQLNLVYDREHDTYSLDDITSVITGIGTKDKFFDYDLSDALEVGQGSKNLLMESNSEWVFLPANYLDCILGRTSDFYKQFNIDDGCRWNLPKNIKKVKERIR